MTLFTLKIPASSANVGAGFDSMGIAVKRFLTLKVEHSDTWEFVHESDNLPKYTIAEDHFIYKVAVHVAEKYNQTMPPCKVFMTSEISLARGLGSSAAAVVAGIELANQRCNLNLTKDEKLQEATVLEGHPDNVAPSIFGQCIISNYTEGEQVKYIQIDELNVDLVLSIPNIELKTETARQVLPETLPFSRAVQASSISNMMVAALLQGEYELAGEMMEKDMFHEPYRAKLIPNYRKIRTIAKSFGGYATVISGAGPTMISFVPKDEGETIAQKLKEHLPDYIVEKTDVSKNGLQIQ